MSKVAIAEKINVFGISEKQPNENVKLVSSNLSDIEQKMSKTNNIILNQFMLDKHEFKERMRIKKESSSEAIAANDDSTLNSGFGNMLELLNSNISQMETSGLSLAALAAAAAAALAAAYYFTDDEEEIPEEPVEEPVAPEPKAPRSNERVKTPTEKIGHNRAREGAKNNEKRAPRKRNTTENIGRNKGNSKKERQTKRVRRVRNRTSNIGHNRARAGAAARPVSKPYISPGAVIAPYVGEKMARKFQDSVDIGSGYDTSTASGSGWGGLLNAIAKGEGNYNSVNRGNAGDTPGGAKSILGKNLTDMTIGEIMTAQSRGQIMAVGRYQFIPSTLKNSVKYAGISKKSKFSSDIQDKLAIATIMKTPSRKRLRKYLSGESNDLHGAMVDLSREWASFPDPDTGRSAYAGMGNNSVQHTIAETKAMLQKARKSTQASESSTFESGVKFANRALGGFFGFSGSIIPSLGKMVKPVAGRISSRFGHRKSPGNGGSTNHKGLDFAAGMGSPIRAALGGVVIKAGNMGGLGRAVVIKHSNGLVTRYGHMSAVKVSEGTTVAAGEVIGRVGSTGNSTGPHLHFEVLKNGKKVDPEPYLKGAVSETTPYKSSMATEPGMEQMRDAGKGHSLAMASSNVEAQRKMSTKPVVLIRNSGSAPSVKVAVSTSGGKSKPRSGDASAKFKAYFT